MTCLLDSYESDDSIIKVKRDKRGIQILKKNEAYFPLPHFHPLLGIQISPSWILRLCFLEKLNKIIDILFLALLIRKSSWNLPKFYVHTLDYAAEKSQIQQEQINEKEIM